MKYVFSAMCAILITIVFTGCEKERAEKKTVIRPVRCEQARSSNGSRLRIFSGTARSGLESNLSFRVGGTVNLMNVEVGDSVDKGHLIATIDSKDYRLQAQEAEAGLEQARAKELNAVANYRRMVKLYENNTVSKSDLDNSRAAYDSSKALVRSIEKKLELARLQMSYTALRAPFKGAVSSVMADENENIAPGHPVISLISESRPEVSVAIPELLIAKVTKGDSVDIDFDAIPGKHFQGVVAEVGVASSRFATTYPVTVTIQEEESGIKPGMVASVSFEFNMAGKEVTLVPSHAVGEFKSDRFVYIAVPEKDGLAKVARRVVTTGALVSGGLEIVSGVSDGDLVITAGMSRLEDGMTVRILDRALVERRVTQAHEKH